MQLFRRILSIDGGGIKGVFPAKILAEMDKHCEGDLRDQFDLIVGTSTGGILAIGLGLGISPNDLLKLYVEKGPEIFGQGRGWALDSLANLARTSRQIAYGPKYESSSLRASLEDTLGERTLGESTTRLVIPAFSFQTGEAFLAKTSHDPRLVTDYLRPAVEVAMATAAAPTFFKPFRASDGIGLVDGGVWANNPVAIAAAEAVGYLGWQKEEIKILSLGTLSSKPKPRSGGALYMGVKQWLTHLFMSGQDSSAMKLARVLTQDASERQTIWRINVETSDKRYGLDKTNLIEEMVGLGAEAAREHINAIRTHFLTGPVKRYAPYKTIDS